MSDNIDFNFHDYMCELKNHLKSPRAFLFLFIFRICTLLIKYKFPIALTFPFIILHKFVNNFFLGLDVPYNAKISGGIRIFHPIGLVIHGDYIIGRNLTIRQNTTIGNLGKESLITSRIGNNVDIGANVVIIGDDIIVGDNVIIGAGTLINKSIPNGSTAVGSSFRILNRLGK